MSAANDTQEHLSYETVIEQRNRYRKAHARLEDRCAALEGALKEIARGGVKFDAKGTWSKRVNEIAREALAAAPTREEEPGGVTLTEEQAQEVADAFLLASREAHLAVGHPGTFEQCGKTDCTRDRAALALLRGEEPR